MDTKEDDNDNIIQSITYSMCKSVNILYACGGNGLGSILKYRQLDIYHTTMKS